MKRKCNGIVGGILKVSVIPPENMEAFMHQLDSANASRHASLLLPLNEPYNTCLGGNIFQQSNVSPKRARFIKYAQPKQSVKLLLDKIYLK